LDERVVASLPRPDLVIGGRRVVSFCSNNYLGLSHLYPVKRAARRALARYSYATTESRKLGGNLQILEQLESRISEFKSAEAAMVCATGLLTNVAAIPAIVDAHGFSSHFYGMPRQSKEHLILFDAGAHQSIRMSLRIARSKSIKFAHNNMQDLERLLSEHRSMDVLIITEGAFSMDGDLSPLAAVADLAGEFDAALYVDDAHGTGVYGPKGRGVVEHFGIASARVSFHMGTFSKAFGAMGGFLAGDAPLIRVLKSFAPGYRFTSSLPAEVAAGIVAAIGIVERRPSLRQKLWRNTSRLRAGLDEIGLDPGPSLGPIIPLVVGSPATARNAEQELLDAGIYCAAAYPPAVSAESCRLRIVVTAMHSKRDIDRLLTALAHIASPQEALVERYVTGINSLMLGGKIS